MSGYFNIVPAPLAGLVVAAGVPSDAPAVIGLAIILIPGGWAIGKAIGHGFDTIGIPRSVVNLKGKTPRWEDALGTSGTFIGILAWLTILAIALIP